MAQAVPQAFGLVKPEERFHLGMRLCPQGQCRNQKRMPLRGQTRPPAPPVLFVFLDDDKALLGQRLQGGGECRAIHGERIGQLSERRWLGTVERHHQGKLPIGQAERTEDVVEMPGKRPCRPLCMKAQAGVADMKRVLAR